MEWSIQELAREAGTTSRTLRYYGEVGLLAPSRIGTGGQRYYDEASLVRLQRILHLRELGLGIPAILDVVAGEQEVVAALRVHLELMKEQQRRLGRQIASVRTAVGKLERGEQLVPAEAFDGFDHTRYRLEVVERWGEDAWTRSDRWWRSLDDEGKQRFQQTQLDIARDFAAAMRAGQDPDGDDAQAIAERHVDWLSAAATPSKDYLLGLGDLYVTDPSFRETYDRHAAGTAAFVRDALSAYVARRFG